MFKIIHKQDITVDKIEVSRLMDQRYFHPALLFYPGNYQNALPIITEAQNTTFLGLAKRRCWNRFTCGQLYSQSQTHDSAYNLIEESINAYHVLEQMADQPQRLKAFTSNSGRDYGLFFNEKANHDFKNFLQMSHFINFLYSLFSKAFYKI